MTIAVPGAPGAEWELPHYSRPPMLNLNRPPRPRLTLRILAHALADVFGLACLAIGASGIRPAGQVCSWRIPSNLAEGLCLRRGGGIAVIFGLRRASWEKSPSRGPELQARYAEYIARNHPGAALPPRTINRPPLFAAGRPSKLFRQFASAGIVDDVLTDEAAYHLGWRQILGGADVLESFFLRGSIRMVRRAVRFSMAGCSWGCHEAKFINILL